jgi:hypothetical protein
MAYLFFREAQRESFHAAGVRFFRPTLSYSTVLDGRYADQGVFSAGSTSTVGDTCFDGSAQRTRERAVTPCRPLSPKKLSNLSCDGTPATEASTTVEDSFIRHSVLFENKHHR